MRTTVIALLVATVPCTACSCERRGLTVAGDASTTSATTPIGERTLEPAASDDAGATRARAAARSEAPAGADSVHGHADADGGVRSAGIADGGVVGGAAAAGEDAGSPAWVPSGASLTIVHGADRDRNLGLVAPAAPPVTFAVDAGAYEVDVSVRPKPVARPGP